MQKNHIYKPDSFVSMPWRNGLGSTVELLKQDTEYSDRFAWRLSMADVSSDGEFSNFSGYDRTLLLLDGNGLTLEFSNNEQVKLARRLDVAKFKGETATFARLFDGAITDFNVMTRRELCSAKVIGCTDTNRQSIPIDCDVLLIYAVYGDLKIESVHTNSLILASQHLLRVDRPESQMISCTNGEFIVVQISYGLGVSIKPGTNLLTRSI